MTDETLLRPATTVSGDERTWRSIADLEQTIGAPLLDRSRHGVEPREYGRALLDGGAAMFDDLRQAVKNIEFIANPTVGEVHQIAPVDSASHGGAFQFNS